MTIAPVRIDYSLAMYPKVQGGVAPEALQQLGGEAEAAVKSVLDRVAAGELGFWNLPDTAPTAAAASELAGQLRSKCDTMVVLGGLGRLLPVPDACRLALERVSEDGCEETAWGALELARTEPEEPLAQRLLGLLSTLPLPRVAEAARYELGWVRA